MSDPWRDVRRSLLHLCAAAALATQTSAQPESSPPPTTPNNAAGSCPGTGDCCEPNGTSGCDDSACCNLICFVEPFCCSIGWDQGCADLAAANCAQGTCGAAGCPGAGDCCSANGGTGCNDVVCCTAVCDSDSFCCESEWDITCAASAGRLCRDVCDPQPPCPGDGDCCLDTDTPGCRDKACCELVCDEDPFCCTGEWDELCAGMANDLCNPTGPFCAWCPGEGTCCEGQGTPGCDKAACCEAVCAQDERCCTVFWFGSCAKLAASLCVNTVCDCTTFGDFDADGVVDLFDASALLNCFTSSAGGPISSPCACADVDGDGDVDLSDLGALVDRIDVK